MRRVRLWRGAMPVFGALVAAGWIAAFEAVVNTEVASSGQSISVAQYQYDKVTICHVAGSGKPVTITVAASAVPAHRRHGDIVGFCPQ